MASGRFGVKSIRVDGQPLELGAEWDYDLGGFTRETAMGADRPAGYKVVPKAPYIEGMVYDLKDVPLQSLRDIQDATVTMELRNGKTFWIRGASQVGDLTVQAHEGQIRLRLEGVSAGEAS